jgi:aspartate aminotransferase-like enzyme
MDPETIAAAGKQSQYFRTPEFSKIMLECVDMLQELLDAPEDTRMIFLTASGTAAMEASVINLFTPKDRVLVLSGGTFGSRFKKICQIHHIPVESIDLEWNEAFRPEMLAAYENKGISGMLVNMCETSTGQLYPMDVISEFCARNGICLVIDAISSFLCDGFRMRTTGAAAVIISSQKGLALQPGMSFVAVTKEAFETRCKQNNPETLYFRFTDYIQDMERGQTPFTPAVNVINQLYRALIKLTDKGLWPHLYHIITLANHFRRQLSEKTNYTIPDYPLSNCLTPVFCKTNNAEQIFKYLKDRCGIYVTPCSGKLAPFLFRVAHMSTQLTEQDIDELIGFLRLM